MPVAVLSEATRVKMEEMEEKMKLVVKGWEQLLSKVVPETKELV